MRAREDWPGRSTLSDKLRVHTLSKELGVTSKAIIAKCKSEDVEGVTNHMSTVSAGLAETIREWFSEESHGTAVEKAAPVDLKKVRVKRRTTRKKKAEDQPKPAEAEAAVAVEEKPPEVAELVAEPPPVSVQAPEPPPAVPEAPPVLPLVTEEPTVPEPGEELPPAEPAAAPRRGEQALLSQPLGHPELAQVRSETMVGYDEDVGLRRTCGQDAPDEFVQQRQQTLGLVLVGAKLLGR